MPEDEVVTEARAAAVARIVPLTEQAESGGKQVTHQHLSIKRFFMAASDMLKQGRNCAAEQDLERAYVLLLRFTTLFLYRLPEHPGFKSAEVAAERKKLKAECMAALDEVEIIKGEIIGRYAAEAEVRIRTEQAEAAAVQAAARVAADEAGRVAALRAAEQAELDEVRAIAAAADAAEAREASVRVAAAAEREAARHAVPTDTGEYDLASELMARCRECASDSDDLLHGVSYPSLDPRSSPSVPSYGAAVPSASLSSRAAPRAVLPPSDGLASVYGLPVVPPPPVVPPSHLSSVPAVTRGMPAAIGTPLPSAAPPVAPPMASPLSGLAAPPAYVPARPSHHLEPSIPRVAPPVTPQPLPTASVVPPKPPPLSGLAALNMGSLSLGGAAEPAGLAACRPTAAAVPAVVPPAPSYTPKLDLSMPGGAPRESPAPWGGRGAVPPPSASTAVAANASGGASAAVCNCRPPPFAWGATFPTAASGAARGSEGGGGSAAVESRGLGCRPLIVPQDLPSAFLRVVSSNTSRNIETCGILVGTIVKGELRCDRIIIPNQTGSSDTCTTTDEDEIWEYCSRLELCTFGWVHTHPSQTCFLSSVDLHTQCGYQSVLDEAVAIVLSPSHTPSVGAFRLSHPSPPGLAEVQRCRKSGFHPDHQRNGQNAGNGVYEEAAHMRWDPIAPIQVVDMRRNK